MFRSTPGTAVPTLATPVITAVYQDSTAYLVDITVGVCDSRYPITAVVLVDGVVVAGGGTLVSNTAGPQTIGAATVSGAGYAQGKTITVRITSLGVTATSAGFVSTYPVFDGTFSFTNASGNAFTDTTPTRYYRAEDIILQANPGYYNAKVNVLWEWKVNGGGSYTASLSRDIIWSAGGDCATSENGFLDASTDGIYLSSAHYTPSTNFRLTITASAAGYTSTPQVTTFTDA